MKEPVDFTKEDDEELAQVYESVQKLGTKAASAFWDKFATKVSSLIFQPLQTLTPNSTRAILQTIGVDTITRF